MNLQTKLALCTALVMASLPLSGAHLNANAPTDAGPAWELSKQLDGAGTNGDGCRYENETSDGYCQGNWGPSGHFVITLPGVFAAAGLIPAEVRVSNYVGVTVFPGGFYFGRGGAFCDMEVLSDGVDGNQDDPLDEKNVDSGTGNGGMLPDATIDDGPDGNVCHVRTYQTPSFNTVGCNGTAYAEDIRSAGNVWLGTSCDWLTTFGGSDENDGLNCALNEAIQGRNPFVILACLTEFVLGTLTPTATPETTACGGDGGSDANRYGRGGGDKVDAGAGGVNYPTLTASDRGACVQENATASAGVMTTVQAQTDRYDITVAETGCLPVPCVSSATAGNTYGPFAAVAGWIDWSNDTAGTGWWNRSAGSHVRVLDDRPECNDGIDNDGDGGIDYAAGNSPPGDAQCSSATDDDEGAESPPAVPNCANGFDDDNDTYTDFDDPGCHNPDTTTGIRDATDPRTYNPTRFESEA